MGLNKSKGNMYEFITHTWNPLAGECNHKCSYCSTNKLMRYPAIKNKYSGIPRLAIKELETNLGKNNFIFVVAQNDLFSESINNDIVIEILNHLSKFDNKYLIQTKNPKGLFPFMDQLRKLDFVLCTTIETNRVYSEIMNNCPAPIERANMINELWHQLGYGKVKTFITIEPIMDFDLEEMLHIIETCLPEQVNIGADSGKNGLPEPDKVKLTKLIEGISKFTTIHNKSNLKRLLK